MVIGTKDGGIRRERRQNLSRMVDGGSGLEVFPVLVVGAGIVLVIVESKDVRKSRNELVVAARASTFLGWLDKVYEADLPSTMMILARGPEAVVHGAFPGKVNSPVVEGGRVPALGQLGRSVGPAGVAAPLPRLAHPAPHTSLRLLHVAVLLCTLATMLERALGLVLERRVGLSARVSDGSATGVAESGF